MVSVAGPWPAVAAAAGGSGLASSDGTRQQRQLTRSVIVWYMSASASLELESVLQAHGDQLATELRLLSELPQVYLTEKCVFDRGNGRIANNFNLTSGVSSAVSCAVASS